MFPRSYFPAAYFAPGYWPGPGGGAPPAPVKVRLAAEYAPTLGLAAEHVPVLGLVAEWPQ